VHSSQAATAIMGGGCPSLPPTAEDAHALGDTSPSMGGAQQEVFKNFIQFMMNSTLLQSEFYIFRILRLILIKLFAATTQIHSQVDVGKRSVVNNCEESSSIIPLFHSPDHLLFLVAINLSSSS
jgi:hypothetical protein